MKSKQGFTLIELLVVIAIIAILAAILFPVFAKAREKARQTTCASNLKQLGIALVQYEQDYDEIIPMNGSKTDIGWAGRIYSYVKSTQVYICPDDINVSPLSYVINGSFTNVNINNSVKYAAISSWNSPAVTVLLAETQYGTGSAATDVSNPSELSSPNMYDDIGTPATIFCGSNCTVSAYGPLNGLSNAAVSYSANPTWFSGPTGRHTDGANFLFCDSHVKWLRGSTVSTGRIAGGPTCNQGGQAVAGCASPEGSGQVIAAGTQGQFPNSTTPAATLSPV